MSRRGLVGRAGGGVAAMALVGAGMHRSVRSAASQDDMGAAWAAAWSTGDAAQVAAIFAPDGTYRDVPTDTQVEGTDAIQGWAQTYFDELSTVSQSVVTWYAIEGGGVAEWSVDATLVSGESVSYTGVSILLMSDGLITRETAYYDLATYYTQTGESCGPAIDGTPEATPTS